MRKRLFKLLFLLCAVLISGSCVREECQNTGSGSDGEVVDCVISFGSPKGATVDVDTKAELGIVRESNVFNIYLLIFEGNASDSKKIYGHYFDGNNLNATSESNYWTVTNMSTKDSPATNGTLHIKTASKAGCTIVAVANMNPNDLDVSAGLLSTIQTFGELQDVVATQVRSEIAANSGFFLMTGQVDGVNIQGNAEDANDISKKSLILKRLYAKVTFNVRVARNPDQSDPDTKNNSLLRDFVPYTWQVVNVPTCSYLLPRAVDAADTPAELFSTEELGFETETLTPNNTTDFYNDGKTPVSIHSFSFYMMENRHAPASGISTYADRERREKPASYTTGTFFDNGDYVYTDPLSAYVVLTGKIVMGISASGNDNATLDANVRYEIHLGNFTSDVADFNTNRNYNYVYNIYIGGAEDIKAEVEAFSTGALTEPEPGATGRVVVALEEVFDSDCHYSTQVISFHANYMDPENISWYVETPFNPDGVGGNDVAAGTAILSQIDYKWVEFFVNKKDSNGSYYSDKRTIYKPHDYDFRDIDGNAIPPGDKRRTMYVNELVDYLKGQKEQYDIDQRKADPDDPSYDPTWVPRNDFDNDNGSDGPKISVTAFIDEYYYTKNPITGQYDPTLWKEIVNHPMRRMHILASSATSADRESSLIGSSFTIQQRSIQSIYAVHEVAGLQSAWGMEFTDDDQETGQSVYWKTKDMEDCGNTSATNGRLNSLKLWGILNPDGTDNMIGQRWDKFLELEGTNETAHLWDIKETGDPAKDYNYLRYSCLSRNRDNDGDGIIDTDEIRWYMASDMQLIGVFLGSYGIEGDARLYQRSASDQANSNKNIWRQHIIASNRYPGDAYKNSNQYPRIVWAEEGVNGSHMDFWDNAEQTTVFSTRCVRNLGYYLDGGQRKDITLAEDPTVEPNAFFTPIRKHLNTDGTVTSPYTGAYDNRTFYEFDCSHINKSSIREPVDHQLIGHDEHSKMACLSSKFETAPDINLVNLNNYTSYSFNNKTYNLKQAQKLNQYLDDSFPNLDSNFNICPEGYRLPNVREISMIWTALSAMTTGDNAYMGTGADTNGSPCRTHWSFGAEGNKKMPNRWGWGMSTKHLLMANSTAEFSKPRCVRDI
jgi:hypothetical protein